MQDSCEAMNIIEENLSDVPSPSVWRKLLREMALLIWRGQICLAQFHPNFIIHFENVWNSKKKKINNLYVWKSKTNTLRPLTESQMNRAS